jgi:hypothetical protein
MIRYFIKIEEAEGDAGWSANPNPLSYLIRQMEMHRSRAPFQTEE